MLIGDAQIKRVKNTKWSTSWRTIETQRPKGVVKFCYNTIIYRAQINQWTIKSQSKVMVSNLHEKNVFQLYHFKLYLNNSNETYPISQITKIPNDVL